ncbi:MAG TPA: dethiobiotin synthase [Solirubrobacteraceae bacterium]|nr:dethiobiotin synthase [Solirubrobacteraceae bacterium]
MRGLFVTGTDTGVGKTVLSAALLAAMAATGEAVRAHKPAVTGLREAIGEDGAAHWPADHELLGKAAGMAPEQVAPLRFGPAVSPQLAAEMAGEPLDRTRLVSAAAAAARTAEQSGSTLIVEGAGGLLSPLASEFTVCDLAVSLRLPLLIAAPPGLGTINHSLLTLQCARAAGLDVRAIVLTPWPEQPSRLEQSNRESIRRLGFVEVDALARARDPELEELARVGAELPWRRWLGERPVAAADRASTSA